MSGDCARMRVKLMRTKTYLVTQIVWDTDDHVARGLPTHAAVTCEGPEFIADELSDMYGWCILSFEADECPW